MKSKELMRVNFSDPEKYQKLIEHLKYNGRPGIPSPFYHLNKHYTHKQSGITDWSGHPASGKTYFVLEYLMSLSEKRGLRHGLYLPDLGTYYEVMEKLVKMYSGKDFTDKYGNKITEKELNNTRAWIDNYFVILIKTDVRRNLTPEAFWEYICDYRDDVGVLDTCLIDSWKNITQEGSERSRDLYLDRVLSYRNELAETYNKHFHTIAHPTKTEMENKKRRLPSMYDLKGGGAWAANGKNVIIVDRPDKTTYSVDIHVQKTKPENVGKEGSVIDRIFLDPKRGRFYEALGVNKFYAYDYQGNEAMFENVMLNEKEEDKKGTMEGINNMKAFAQKEIEKEDDNYTYDPNENPF